MAMFWLQCRNYDVRFLGLYIANCRSLEAKVINIKSILPSVVCVCVCVGICSPLLARKHIKSLIYLLYSM